MSRGQKMVQKALDSYNEENNVEKEPGFTPFRECYDEMHDMSKLFIFF